MDSDDEEEKEKSKGPKFPIQMYISEGNKHLRLAKYDTAIGFFDTALEKEPNNVNSLIGRSKCKMRLAKFSEAREDAEAALKINPKSSEAKMLIGEADYFLGDFEKSFLTFYRGHSARPNWGGLRLGHQMCRRAIDNALQPDKRMIIRNHDVVSLSNLEDKQGAEQASQLKTKRDSLSTDVDFVETLLNDANLDSVHPHCEYLITYLRERQIFWRTQNPDSSERIGIETDSSAAGKKDSPNIADSVEMQAENVTSNTESEDDPNIDQSVETQAQNVAPNTESKDYPNIAESVEMEAQNVAPNTEDENDPNITKSVETKAENVASNADMGGQDESASPGQSEEDTK